MLRMRTSNSHTSILKLSKIRIAIVAFLSALVLVYETTTPAVALSPTIGPTTGGTGVTIQGIHFDQVASGSYFTIGLTSSGTVYSWGKNTYGQLGIGTFGGSSSYPVIVLNSQGTAPLTSIRSIEAGANMAAAITSDGELFTWGLNAEGLLGDGTTSSRSLPVRVKDPSGNEFLSDVSQISTGPQINMTSTHMLAVTHSGNVFAWGKNTYGELGDGTGISRLLPVMVKDPTGTGDLSGIQSVAAGADHSLALTNNGEIFAWGNGFSGKLGNGQSASAPVPVSVLDSNGAGPLTGVAQIEAGATFSIARTLLGEVFAWGRGTEGQMGNATNGIETNLPVRVSDISGTGNLAEVRQISAGAYHSLALLNSGNLVAWGYNDSGQLGNGNNNLNSNIPTGVIGLSGSGAGLISEITQISAGSYHSSALDTNGQIVAWGYNGEGELGNGTSTSQLEPILGVNFVPFSVSFGSSAVSNISRQGTEWHLITPPEVEGITTVSGTAYLYAGTFPASPSEVSWDVGIFTFESPALQSLASTGAAEMIAVLLVGLLLMAGGGMTLQINKNYRRWRQGASS